MVELLRWRGPIHERNAYHDFETVRDRDEKILWLGIGNMLRLFLVYGNTYYAYTTKRLTCGAVSGGSIQGDRL